MKTIVCVKVVNGELNPFDECAVEAALQIDGNEVTVISMGPLSSADNLKMLTRLGVQRAILVSDSDFAGSDTLATSYILSECIKKLDYDAIFCGRQTIDGDTAQVGPCLATLLNIEPITNVMQVKFGDNCVECETRIGNYAKNFPVLLTFERINTLRFPSIRSKAHDIEVWNNSNINADISRCGLNGSPTKVLKVFECNKGQRQCKYITRYELMPLLEKIKSQPQIKQNQKNTQENKTKLQKIWAIGHEVEKQAYEISKEVVFIDEKNPYKIAELIKEGEPEVVLWNADLNGRRNAPIAAAILKTGLCADCTQLETDGKKLFMYRPAKSGNITAKIKCDTMPQMATVRTQTKSDNIIVSGGKGIINKLEEFKKFATDIGAEICASRGLVDSGYAPYNQQVGLTGKNVCPQIYIAIGISGAVHHTVGIENAGTIIAINPDKNARIFEYADYGIVDNF